MRRLAVLLVLLALSPSSVRAGGSPIGFVSLPAANRLVIVELANGGRLATIALPEPTAVVSSGNGRCVLVVSPHAGVVTQIDGVRREVVRTFRGVERPVDVALDFEPPTGVVTPRYAFVLDEVRGSLVALDLRRARIAARTAVGAHPDRLVVDGSTVWVAHTASRTLTRVDVTGPGRPRVLDEVDAGGIVGGLAVDPRRRSVFVAHGGFVARFVEDEGRVHRVYERRVSGVAISGLAIALPDFLVAADPTGRLHLMREQTGTVVKRLHMRRGIEAITVYGGWLVARLARSLGAVGLPDGSMRTSVPLDAAPGGFGWAVLP